VSASQCVCACMIHLRHLHAVVQSHWPKPSKWRVQSHPSFVAGTVVLRRIGAQDPDADTRPFRVLRAVPGQLRWTDSKGWPYVSVVLLFIGFAMRNQGMLLEDKSNHQATFHGAFVLYFFAGAMVFTRGIPAMLRVLVRRGCRRSLSDNSHTHPFLLGGNLHYTVYILRKSFLSYSVAKSLPAPIYAASIGRPQCHG
jgi:hypothetical protein